MVNVLPFGGEYIFGQLLCPLDKTPGFLIGKKREFVMFCGAIASSLFLFKLLMRNLVPSVFELFAVWFVTCAVILALMLLVRLVNSRARKRNIVGIAAVLLPLLLFILLF